MVRLGGALLVIGLGTAGVGVAFCAGASSPKSDVAGVDEAKREAPRLATIQPSLAARAVAASAPARPLETSDRVLAPTVTRTPNRGPAHVLDPFGRNIPIDLVGPRVALGTNWCVVDSDNVQWTNSGVSLERTTEVRVYIVSPHDVGKVTVVASAAALAVRVRARVERDGTFVLKLPSRPEWTIEGSGTIEDDQYVTTRTFAASTPWNGGTHVDLALLERKDGR